MIRLAGKEFEQLVIEHAERDQRYTVTRYGTQSSHVKDKVTGQPKVVTVQSLPDFDAVLSGARQFIFDCKVCSSSSIPMANYVERGARRRQLRHMYNRSKFGVPCAFVIHWNERVMATKTEPFETWWLPVSEDHPFWERVESLEVRSINRRDCEEYGYPVEWVTSGQRGTKERPDVCTAVERMYYSGAN